MQFAPVSRADLLDAWPRRERLHATAAANHLADIRGGSTARQHCGKHRPCSHEHPPCTVAPLLSFALARCGDSVRAHHNCSRSRSKLHSVCCLSSVTPAACGAAPARAPPSTSASRRT